MFNRAIRAPLVSDSNTQSMAAWYSGGKAGLLVNIGAVGPLIGSAFVQGQVDDMQKHGFQAIWTDLPKPEWMRGVGRGSQKCSRRVNLVGALHDGKLLGFDAPVLDYDPESPESAMVPPLYSLTQLAGDNALFCRKIGRMYIPPEGEAVSWPGGTRILQCERAPGGHWLLGVGHWDRVDRKELQRVRDLRKSGAGLV